jgi:hypothetical protein
VNPVTNRSAAAPAWDWWRCTSSIIRRFPWSGSRHCRDLHAMSFTLSRHVARNASCRDGAHDENDRK